MALSIVRPQVCSHGLAHGRHSFAVGVALLVGWAFRDWATGLSAGARDRVRLLAFYARFVLSDVFAQDQCLRSGRWSSARRSCCRSVGMT